MNTEKGKKSIIDRWKLDIQAYEQGSVVKTSIPQCEKCAHYIQGDALH